MRENASEPVQEILVVGEEIAHVEDVAVRGRRGAVRGVPLTASVPGS